LKKPYQPFQPLLEDAGQQRFELSAQQQLASGNLNGIVHSYLQIQTSKATPYPIIPDGTQAVFINPDGSTIGGAYSRSRDMQIPQPGFYFGIRFYPGALRHLFSLDLSEISDQLVDSHFLPCKHFSQLHDEVYRQDSFQHRVKCCEQWILKHISGAIITSSSNPFDHALDIIYRSFGNIDIATLAAKVDLSSRHLNRLFKQHVGLSTKTFTQIIRIQSACKNLLKHPNNSLRTAIDLGYFDQAHLLNEYKRRLLLNPHSFSKRFRSDFYNRAAL